MSDIGKPEVIAAAIDQAFGKAATDLIVWTLGAMSDQEGGGAGTGGGDQKSGRCPVHADARAGRAGRCGAGGRHRRPSREPALYSCGTVAAIDGRAAKPAYHAGEMRPTRAPVEIEEAEIEIGKAAGGRDGADVDAAAAGRAPSAPCRSSALTTLSCWPSRHGATAIVGGLSEVS